jgi:hypothetical protein
MSTIDDGGMMMAHMHFQIPFEEQKDHDKQQRCKSAHAKIDFKRGKN